MENKNLTPEEYLFSIIDEWLKEGDIKNGKLNKKNLDRFNMANFLAILIFKDIKSINFEMPKDNLSVAQSFFKTNDIWVEDIESKDKNNKKLFTEFFSLIDFFGISGAVGGDLFISFGVNNVFEGEELFE